MSDRESSIFAISLIGFFFVVSLLSFFVSVSNTSDLISPGGLFGPNMFNQLIMKTSAMALVILVVAFFVLLGTAMNTMYRKTEELSDRIMELEEPARDEADTPSGSPGQESAEE
jgi:uncharacterized membrane protein